MRNCGNSSLYSPDAAKKNGMPIWALYFRKENVESAIFRVYSMFRVWLWLIMPYMSLWGSIACHGIVYSTFWLLEFIKLRPGAILGRQFWVKIRCVSSKSGAIMTNQDNFHFSVSCVPPTSPLQTTRVCVITRARHTRPLEAKFFRQTAQGLCVLFAAGKCVWP